MTGPVSADPAVLEKMMETGMNVARLNFSHGSHEYHAQTIKNVRTAVKSYSDKLGMTAPLAIALDTKGPEIRTGLLEGVCYIVTLDKITNVGFEVFKTLVLFFVQPPEDLDFSGHSPRKFFFNQPLKNKTII